MDTPFTIVSSPAMQVKEAAEEREHLAKTAAADSWLIEDVDGPYWRAVERAENLLAQRGELDMLKTLQGLDKQNDARGREIARLRARVAEALQRIEAGPQMVDDRVEEHWSVVAHGVASVLRAAHTDH